MEKLNQQLEQRVADQVGEIERMSRLRRFLPPQVADLIVASGSEKQLESHRREITALFCDLRGFTGFTESADAEDVMALLRDYHAAIGEIIIKYNGTLERYAGDGVMVVFNDPVPVENPALQAVLMALEVREAIGALTGNVASVRARYWLRYRHRAWLRHARHHRFRGSLRLRRHRDGFQCGLSALRRGEAGANPDQPPSADKGRERRESRAGGRVRVEGDQAATGGVQCGGCCFVNNVSVSIDNPFPSTIRYASLHARMTEMAEQRTERRLAAILAGDVAGYSKLMGADEEDTLTRFNAHRREFLEPKIAEHRGRIVKRTGDGVLIEFASAVDATRCAVEIQRGMTGRNAEVPPERRIEFRIGIHVGDIIVEEDDIFGDGVNIAARLESIAEPGGVSISEDAWRQVQGKVDAIFVDTGEQNLKNIARRVRVYRAELNQGNANQQIARNLAFPDGPSIAVLPFQNMSGDPEQDYFCDGMVEDIITGLARIKWLFVIGRNSTFAYKGKSPDIRQVGRDLGVRYVLEGSVRRVGNRVRITSQLVDAQTGVHLWAERFDRSLDDVFALQDEITLSVIGAIEPSLRQAEIKRVERKRPSDLNAYDLVLRAIPLAHSVMPDGASRGLTFLGQALAREPDYAAAHGYAAWCHEILFLRGGFREENRIAAIRHAHDALVHGRDDATALALAGFVVGLLEHDHATASDAFEAALSLSPSSAFSYHLGSVIAGWAGDAERAVEWGERALRLSPFDPLSYLAYDSVSVGHFRRGRYEEAIGAARKAIQFNPGFSINYVLLAAPLVKLSRLNEARTAVARVLELQPSFSISKQFNSVGCARELTSLLTDALIEAGLPP